jgi:DNA invertase Pin-like site-specific DNA recombinase
MIRGYARVSTDDQSLALQIDALKRAGVESGQLYTDRASGASLLRPGFEAVMTALGPGDSLIVWRLDRLTRGIRHLLELLPDLDARAVRLVSLTEQIDTSHATGRMIVHILGVLGQYERELSRERAAAGVVSARAAGRQLGRSRSLSPNQVEKARELAALGHSIRAIGAAFDVSRGVIRAAIDGTGAYAAAGGAFSDAETIGNDCA